MFVVHYNTSTIMETKAPTNPLKFVIALACGIFILFSISAAGQGTSSYENSLALIQENLKMEGTDNALNINSPAQFNSGAGFENLKDGSIGEIQTTQSPDRAFTKSVMELIGNMPLWTPAYSDSKPVKSVYSLKVNFLLR
jgi:hypothetical protein